MYSIPARLGKKVDVVVCSGGDGTLNETISGMMKLKKMPLLGYIPAGSTNDFATSLGIPKRMPLAAWDIVEGTPFAIDTGTFCEDMNFMYIAAFGAFTEVSYLTSQDRKNLLGHQAYMLEGVKSLAGLKPYHMKVEWDGQVLEEDFAFGMVTNTISATSMCISSRHPPYALLRNRRWTGCWTASMADPGQRSPLEISGRTCRFC